MQAGRFAAMAAANAEKKAKQPQKDANASTNHVHGTVAAAANIASAPPARLVTRDKVAFALPPVSKIWIGDFTWPEVRYATRTRGVPVKGIPSMIPLRNASQGPMLIEYRRGGSIPQPIGLAPSRRGNKMRLTCTIHDLDERKATHRIYQDLQNELRFHCKEWFPNVEITNWEASVQRVLSEVKAKNDGSADWDQLASFAINPEDLEEKNGREALLQITMPGETEGTTKRLMDLNFLPGLKWETMTVELQYLIPGTNENEKSEHYGKPLLTLSRRVRRMFVTVDESLYHTVYPHEEAAHAALDCKRKHNQPMLATAFSLAQHAMIGPLTTKEQTTFCSLTNVGGGDIILMLRGGGQLPEFVISRNQHGDLVFSAGIDDPKEEQALDTIRDELKAYVVKKRHEFFPDSDLDDATLAKLMVKNLLGAKSKKPENAELPRQFNCIFDQAKIGTGVHIVDALGRPITDPDSQLKHHRWEEIWVHLKCLYRQTKSAGVLWETGYSRRLLYCKVAADMNDFVLDDTAAATRPRPAAVGETDPKRARVTEEVKKVA